MNIFRAVSFRFLLREVSGTVALLGRPRLRFEYVALLGRRRLHFGMRRIAWTAVTPLSLCRMAIFVTIITGWSTTLSNGLRTSQEAIFSPLFTGMWLKTLLYACRTCLKAVLSPLFTGMWWRRPHSRKYCPKIVS